MSKFILWLKQNLVWTLFQFSANIFSVVIEFLSNKICLYLQQLKFLQPHRTRHQYFLFSYFIKVYKLINSRQFELIIVFNYIKCLLQLQRHLHLKSNLSSFTRIFINILVDVLYNFLLKLMKISNQY